MNRKKKLVLIVAGLLLSLGLMAVGILAATNQSLFIRGRLSTAVKSDEDVLVNATVWYKVADDEYQKIGTKFATTDSEEFDADIDMRDELSVTYKIVMVNYGIAANLDVTVSDEDDTQFSDNFIVMGSDTEDFADPAAFAARPKADGTGLKEFIGNGVFYIGEGFGEETFSTYYVRFTLMNPKTMTLNYSMLLEFNEAAAETPCTLTFESNGGSQVPGITETPGTAITAPEDPARDGYNFDAWYTTAALSEAFVFVEMPDTSIKLYAGWIPIVYSVTYENLQGGSNPNAGITQYTVETPTITFAPPEGRIGSTGSWDIAEIPLGSTGDKVITAVWVPIVYSVTYENLQDGTNPNAGITQYTIETATITLVPPTRVGYTGSWNIAEIPLGSTGDKVITAVWTPIVYSVTYENLQGGTNPNAGITQYTIETATITFAPPTRVGYTGSWDITEIPLGSTGDKVITAVWVPTVYSVTYENLQDGTNPNAGITQYTIETAAITFAPPTRVGYTGSWDITEIPLGSTGDKVITAVWETKAAYFELEGGAITAITEEARALAEIIIPRQINGTDVTAIGTDVFRDCANLTSVTIPPTVTSIGNNAFQGCTSLGSVTLPESLTSLGNFAFQGCTGLGSVTLPESLTSLGYGTFYGCTDLGSVTLPESLTSIGLSVFSGCTSLASVTLPESLTSIGGYAFRDCTGLASVTLPESLTSIGIGAFYGCTGLGSVTLPESLTSIGASAFRDCTGLGSVTLPESLTSIGNSAFRGCTGLASVTLPESLTSLDNNAFNGCTALTAVYVGRPASMGLTTLGTTAFDNCHASLVIYVPDTDSVTQYKAADNWSRYAAKIQLTSL